MAEENFQLNDESDDLNIIDGGGAWLDQNPMGDEEDRVSFEDSERFEDDSVCSWVSENEALNQKWSEWRASSSSDIPGPSNFEPCQPETNRPVNKIPALADMAALNAAKLLSFDAIEQIYHHLKPGSRIPDDILKPILKRCFPRCPEDIRTYSFIANGSPVQFNDGMQLYEHGAVQNVIQIGYHISSVVSVTEALPTIKGMNPAMRVRTPKSTYNISIRVDRCRIVSCNCSCSKDSCWCQHVVAVCMQRIYKPDTVDYRGTIWDSITELSDEKLKKFAQYMINELPREYLPIAQKLIDELRCPVSEINRLSGAPDPTAGSNCDLATWCMDEKQLHDSIRKILIHFVKPTPTVHCDLNYLSSTLPLANAELSWLMRTQLAHSPEPLWKLLEIVVHMLKRGDENATTLLHAITVHCLCVDQVLMWWYQTRLVASGHWIIGNTAQRGQCSQNQLQRGAANTLCEEIVRLWRLAALNPKLNAPEREQLAVLLQLYHHTAVKRILRMLDNLKTLTIDQSLHDKQGLRLSSENAPFSVQIFPGFFPALQICHLDWSCSTIRNACKEVSATEFIGQLERHNQHAINGISVVNLPILRYGTDCLVDELVNTEHQITTTLSLEEFFAQKTRSKRTGKKKRRHRELSSKTSQNMRNQLRQLRLSMHNYKRRDDNEQSEDSAADDEEPGPSTKQTKRQKNPKFDLPVEREIQEIDDLFAKAHEEMDNIQKLFACCEAMVCYGSQREAQLIAEKLTFELFNKPPKLIFDLTARAPKVQQEIRVQTQKTNSTYRTASNSDHQATEKSSVASSPNLWHRRSLPCALVPPSRDELNTCKKIIINLKRTLFVLKCLLKDMPVCPVSTMKAYDYENQSFRFKDNSLALKLAINTLLNPRSPAPTKQMEVQILILEHELWKFLHTIQLSASDIQLLRDVAEDFLRRDPTTMCIRKFAVPPILFGHYILNALSFTYQVEGNCPTRRMTSNVRPMSDSSAMSYRKPSDDKLAIAVALATLQMKVKFLEKDYLMQFEWIRKQRGELATVMLARNSNSVEKLNLILDRFLDPTNHCIYSAMNTNAILVRTCPQNHPFLFCTCWRSLEAGLSAFAIKPSGIKSETQSRRNSDKNELSNATNDQVQFRLQCMGSSSSSTDPHETNDHSSVTSDSSSANRVRTDLECACRTEEQQQSCSSSRYSDSGSSGLCMTQEYGKFYGQIWAATNGDHRRPTTYYSRQSGKHMHLTIQPSEDHVLSLVDIAKRFSPGGPQTSNIFNADHLNNVNNVSDRQLQMCGFIISLYALGINNKISDSWPTRTYSMIVSWIDSHIVDLGPEAFQIVLDTWESHFTPSEFLTLIEKACMSADDRLLVMTPELALSALRRASSLTHSECSKALNICRESSIQHWEKACLLIEEAAQHDSVCPQVLFKVAENWYQMYSSLSNNSSALNNTQQFSYTDTAIPPALNWVPPIQPQQQQPQIYPHQYNPPDYYTYPHPANNQQFYNDAQPTTSNYPVYNTHVPPYPHQQLFCQPPPHVQYTINAAQRLPNGSRVQPQRLHVSHSAPNLQPALMMQRVVSQQQKQMPEHALGNMPMNRMVPPHQLMNPTHGYQRRQNEITPLRNIQITQQHQIAASVSKPPSQYCRIPTSSYPFAMPRTSPQWQLFKSYELGMKALDKLAPINPEKYFTESDTRNYSKYSKTPEFQTDILALLKVSMQLGHVYVHGFCEKVTVCVESPFLLVLLLETALYASSNKLATTLNTEHVTKVHLTANRVHQNYINFQLIGQQIQDLMLQFGYMPPYAELGRACAEMLYRATASKLNYTSKSMDSNKLDLKELIELADKFFSIFERCGPTLRDAFLSTMRKQKHGRTIDELIKEGAKS